jgi:CheY-like chemotaxis protein
MRILVVDDELGFGSLMGRVLRRLGHEALVFAHPVDAIDRMDETVDAVITDIDMPVMNGVELARTIRRMRSDIPIAFCTGSDPAEPALKEATQIGRVLPKVWTIEDVKATVAHLAAQRNK